MNPILLLLGLLDGLSGITLVLLYFGFEPTTLVVGLSFYLIAKAVFFLGDITSIIDATAGLYMLVTLFIFPSITLLTFIFAIFLAQKTMFSFLYSILN